MTEREQQLTLTKEQAELLLPLLPSLFASTALPKQGENTQDAGERYIISEKKGKNSRSTRAQNYLLVSVV